MIDSRTIRATARTFAASCAAVGLVGVVATQVPIENRVVVLLAGMLPLLLVWTLWGAVVAVAARAWATEAVCLAVCVLGVMVLAPLYVPGAGPVAPSEATGPTVRIMQANIRKGQADPDDLVATVRERDIDILTVQENTDRSGEALQAAGIDELLPHRFVVSYGDDPLGGAIYSRYPLSETRSLTGYLSANLTADVDVGLREPLALIAVHPAPAYLFPARMWAEELRGLHEEMQEYASRDNVVVSGDFNASYPQPQYRALLTDGYADAADQVGAGLVPTMPAHRRRPAMTGIDRIITKGAAATSLERFEIVGSDHHGVIAEIRLRDDSPPVTAPDAGAGR